MDRDRRRRFGQNFLDVETANLLASDIPLSAGDSILEIGPGHGSLTEPLLAQGVPVTAVEIDLSQGQVRRLFEFPYCEPGHSPFPDRRMA